MLKIRFWIVFCLGFVGAALIYGPHNAQGRPLYLKVYRELYPSSVSLNKCAICHVGQDKKNRNDYGKAVEEALGTRNVKEVDAIKAALKKVEDKRPSDNP